jgi:hypothetical protein
MQKQNNATMHSNMIFILSTYISHIHIWRNIEKSYLKNEKEEKTKKIKNGKKKKRKELKTVIIFSHVF